jgi:hypothetical protein
MAVFIPEVYPGSTVTDRARLESLSIRPRGEHVLVLDDGTRLRVNRLRRGAVEQALEHRGFAAPGR